MRVLFALLLAGIIVACAPEDLVCTSPYIINGNTCCLDKDDDGFCDISNESEEPEGISCDLCPPRFVTNTDEVIVYKYVCVNKSIMDSPDECEKLVKSNAHLFTPKKTQDEKIKKFAARVACRGEHNAAEMNLVMEESPRQVIFEAKSEPQGKFKEIGIMDGKNSILDDEYFYIGFCESAECVSITDAQLSPDTAHLVRARLDFVTSELVTRERLLDPTPDGEYGLKKC